MLVLLSSLLFIFPFAFTANVRLGDTIITGQDLPALKQELFAGIPYAEKPIRFHPPILKPSLNTGTLDAHRFGPACLSLLPPNWIADNTSSEDCLTINILRPSGLSPDSRLPVMVWINGGAFTASSGSSYNGSLLVGHSVDRGTPIIHVSFNYRLGPLGFPQGFEAERKGAQNLGLKDQLTALRWVQVNIGTFGGDKTKVTVFGESAGAVSIGFLYLNSQLETLVRAAIFESGSAATTPTFRTSRRQVDWVNFVSAVPECSSVASASNTFDCLSDVSSSTLLNAFETSKAEANEQFPWVPTIDGPDGIIPELPSNLWAQGQFSKIPFVTGSNLDEATEFTSTTVNSSHTIREWIVANCSATFHDTPRLHAAVDRILELYPDEPALGSPYNTGNETFGLGSQYKRLASILGDIFFHSLRRLWIQSASDHGVKTFGYLFSDPAPAQIPPSLGVPHTVELSYLYPENVFFPGINVTLSLSAQNLSLHMLDYWISFATSLDPNDGKGMNRPKWPQYQSSYQTPLEPNSKNAYSSDHRNILQLNSKNLTVISDDYRAEQIAFINSHSNIFRH